MVEFPHGDKILTSTSCHNIDVMTCNNHTFCVCHSIMAIVLIVSTLNPNRAYSQKDKTGTAIAAAGVAASIIGGIVAMEQLEEALEYEAVNHMLGAHPDWDSFELKLLDMEGKKLSDMSSVSVTTFGVRRKHRGKWRYAGLDWKDDPFVLIMVKSPGWINEFGIDLTRVRWYEWGRQKWNETYRAYIEMYSSAPLSSVSLSVDSVPICRTIGFSDLDSNNVRHFSAEASPNVWQNYEVTNEMTPVKEVEIKRSGVSSRRTGDLVVPFQTLKGDDYRTALVGGNLIFVNERAFGVYDKALGETFQFQRSLVNEIHRFVNSGF